MFGYTGYGAGSGTRAYNLNEISRKAAAPIGIYKLLMELTTPEIAELVQHEDLITKVGDIVRMTSLALEKTLQERYLLEVTECQTGNYWLGVSDELATWMPDWLVTHHQGYWCETREFTTTARIILLRDVRINLWMRYLERKKAA